MYYSVYSMYIAVPFAVAFPDPPNPRVSRYGVFPENPVITLCIIIIITTLVSF